jgi:triosephosphate isomerase
LTRVSGQFALSTQFANFLLAEYSQTMKYFIANWKTNKTRVEVDTWKKELSGFSAGVAHGTDLELVVCPSFPYLTTFQEFAPWKIGVQTVSAFPNGAYTGAVSALMASQFAQYAIVGHAERRKYFAETDEIVAQQTEQVVQNGMTPILAVDDHNWAHQMNLIDATTLKKTLVMYEPPEAISTSGDGKAADIDHVLEALSSMTSSFEILGGVYGGSVSIENISQYVLHEKIDGVVVGAASLDAGKVKQMLAVIS